MPALAVDAPVVVPMRRDLVPTVGDPGDQLRMTLGYPAKDEKGCRDAGRVEQGEQSVDISFHPPRECIPTVTRKAFRQRLGVKIIFHIDRHDIAQGGAGTAAYRGQRAIAGHESTVRYPPEPDSARSPAEPAFAR